MYDYIIVGSGLYGATLACLLREQGKRCLVLERRDKIGGNIRDEWRDGINVHLYGAHIFHTDNEQVWQFVNRFARFNNYVHRVLTRRNGQMIHLPISLLTFEEAYGITKAEEIDQVLEEEHRKEYYPTPQNLEEKAVNMIGRKVYELIIREYTEKQWGRSARQLPSEIITRIPVRRNTDDRYFSDPYQGIPVEGYSPMIARMLEGTEVITGVDFVKERDLWMGKAKKIIFTGMIDELMDYRLGELPYRGLCFETTDLPQADYQGMAVVNEAKADVPYTRTIEHRHFMLAEPVGHTIITREYPQQWQRGIEAYYPIRNAESQRQYDNYLQMAKEVYPNISLGGRLGGFRYYDMDDTIAAAMNDVAAL